MPGISPKLPLTRNSAEGYRLTKTLVESVHQNFKMVLLTAPGERIMDPDFGVGLRNYIFRVDDAATYDEIREKIVEQASIYLPFIEILGVFFSKPDEFSGFAQNSTNIHIEYIILPTDDVDTLTINLPETI